MTDVEIEYCVPCGLRDRAMQTQEVLLEAFGRRLETVTLRTGDGGVFEVRVDGDLIFDKDEEGYDPERIRAAVAARVEESA